MSREWFAVHTALIRKPRFRRLSEPAQLTLIYAWAIAGDQQPEATWNDDDELADSLELVGRDRATLAELPASAWIETAQTEQGPRTRIRDWDKYQMAATVSARNAWQAAYMKDWRKAKASAKDKTEQDNTGHNRTGLTTRDPRVVNTDWDSFTNPVWNGFKEAWMEYGLRLPPTMRQREPLFRIVDAYPTKIVDWIGAAPRGLNAYDLVQFIFRKHAQETSDIPADELPTRIDPGATHPLHHFAARG